MGEEWKGAETEWTRPRRLQGRMVVAVQAGGHATSRRREEDRRCLWLWRMDMAEQMEDRQCMACRGWKVSQDGSERHSVQGGIGIKAKGDVWRRSEGGRDWRTDVLDEGHGTERAEQSEACVVTVEGGTGVLFSVVA